MITKPIITITPNKTSYHLILDLLTKGSIKAVQKEAVAKPARQTEILDTLAAPKNKIQCSAITAPVTNIFTSSFCGSRTFDFLHQKITPKNREAISVR